MGLFFWKKKYKVAVSEKDLIESAEMEVRRLIGATIEKDWVEIERLLNHTELGLPYLTKKMKRSSRKEFAKALNSLRAAFDEERPQLSIDLQCHIGSTLKKLERKI